MGKTSKSTHISQNIGQELSGRLIGKPWKPFGKVGQETGFGLSITWKHLEDPGNRFGKAARQKSPENRNFTRHQKTNHGKSMQGHRKTNRFPKCMPLVLWPKPSRQVSLEPSGKPPENNQEKRWVAGGSNNVTQPFFTTNQIVSPSHLKLQPK